MNERAREILSDASRWAKDAWIDWKLSIMDSPPAHVYTLIVGAALAIVARLVI